MSQHLLTDQEIDKLLADKELLVPSELLPRVREACRGLKSLANSLQKKSAR